ASSRRPGLPEAFDDLLRCTLERIPERRPARASTLQRTLAELSYASSIVATALDVAEAIERVIVPTDTPLPERAEPEQGPARALDDVIRAQLGPVDNGTRVTATAELEELPPRPLTIVRTGVGGDGLDQWRLDAGGDDGPTGSAGAGQAEADPGDRGVIAPGDRGALAASSRRSGLRLGAVAMGGVAVAAVSWLVLAPGGGPAAAEVADAGLALAVPADAAPPRQPVLVVTVQPEDAELWVDGVQIPGASPFEHPLMAEQSHTVELRREGYQSHRREMTLFEGELRRTLDVSLAPMRIQLMVSSTPPGAEVLLDGRALGRTPLVRDLDAAELALLREHPLVLERRGYRSESVTGLTPLPGQPIRVERTLEPVPRAQPTGKVRVHMDGTWAYAYLRGKRVGQVPGELELPAGRHQLRLVNPISEVEWALSVEVKAGQTIYRRVAAEP
ncbi:PEGA domain-containing protein, partial [Haliangium sp.]